jgi:hypothetical protein
MPSRDDIDFLTEPLPDVDDEGADDLDARKQ